MTVSGKKRQLSNVEKLLKENLYTIISVLAVLIILFAIIPLIQRYKNTIVNKITDITDKDKKN